MINPRRRQLAVFLVCFAAAFSMGLIVLGWALSSRTLSQLIPAAVFYTWIVDGIWHWLLEQRTRTRWRHGMVRDEEGQRLGLHAPRDLKREVGRWVIYSTAGAALSLGLGSALDEGRWFRASLGGMLLTVFAWRRLGKLFRQISRQSGVCLTAAGITLDGSLIHWSRVHSVLLKDKIYPVLAIETSLPRWRQPDHTIGFGRTDKDPELYRVLNHYVRHPEHRHCLEDPDDCAARPVMG